MLARTIRMELVAEQSQEWRTIYRPTDDGIILALIVSDQDDVLKKRRLENINARE